MVEWSLSLFAENCRIPRQSFVYRLLQHSRFFSLSMREQGLAHDSAVAVKDTLVGNAMMPRRKRPAASLRQSNVAVIRAGHFEQLLRGFNAPLVAVQRFHVDADDLAAPARFVRSFTRSGHPAPARRACSR